MVKYSLRKCVQLDLHVFSFIGGCTSYGIIYHRLPLIFSAFKSGHFLYTVVSKRDESSSPSLAILLYNLLTPLVVSLGYGQLTGWTEITVCLFIP